jgi:hypothetical protein
MREFYSHLWNVKDVERDLVRWLDLTERPEHAQCLRELDDIHRLDQELGWLRHHFAHIPFDEVYDEDSEDFVDRDSYPGVPSAEEYERELRDAMQTAEKIAENVGKKIATRCVKAT